MSTVVEQEDVADSGKDDENNFITAASSVPGNASGDTAGVHFDDNPPPDTSTENIQKTEKPEILSVDKAEDKIPDETDKQTGYSIPIKTFVSLSEVCVNEFKKDNVLSTVEDTLAAKGMEFVGNITDSQADIKDFDVSKPMLETGYKETVIDDASDSEIELHWSDDENDDEMDAEPLSNEALKRLDMELGIADADSTENSKGTQEVINVASTPVSLFNIEKPEKILVDDKKSEAVILAQNSMKTEKLKEMVDDTSKTVESGNSAQISMEIENTKEIVGDTNSESVKTVCDEAVNRDQELDIDSNEKYHKINTEADREVKQISQSNERDSNPVEKPINLVESCSDSINIGANVESNLESANADSEQPIVTEADKPMDIDIPSVQCELPISDAKTVSDKTESLTKSVNNEKLTHLVKEMEVDEEDKISEIDIDETIVDLKHLIDQDEDTIKQLGLDVGKSSDKSNTKDENEHISRTVEKETKSTEYESESVKLANVDIESVKIDSDTTKNNQNEDAQPMAEDTCTKKSLETGLCEQPLQKTEITEVTSPSEDDIKISNDKVEDTNDTLEYVPRTVTDEIDFGSGNITTKEPDSVNKEGNDNTKNILQIPDDQIDIQQKKYSKVAIEEYENDKTKEKLTAQIDKDETKNDTNTTSQDLIDQKLVEKVDNVENDSTTQIENLVGNNVGASEVLEIPSEPNEDENPETVSKVTEKDTEEFIIPDVTNDSIKINTDHRINRPDVMLDIPTQEFDFDDFDDTSDMQTDKTDKNESDLTTKTVTQIVNQLAKETEDMDTDEIEKIDVNATKTISVDQTKEINDIKPTQDADIHNKTKTKDIEMSSIENITDTTKKVAAETKNADITGETTPTQKDDKDLKSTENFDKPKKTLQTDSISTENLEKTKHFDAQPPTSSEGTKDTTNKIPITQENDKFSEVGSSAETVQKPENIDPQPSTSEGITEEDQEVTDSLGLLAESARVMEDDDDEEQEPEEDEADDADVDDDDDFDPDEEESSNQTGEHSEESNPPHSELDIQEDGIDIEFNNEVDKIGLDSNESTFDQKTDSKSVDSPVKVPETSTDVTKKSKERRSSILADLLTKPAAEMNLSRQEDAKSPDKLKKNEISKAVTDESIVDLEGSSEDDVQESKDSTQEAPSVTQKAQQDGVIKMIKVNIEGASAELDYEDTKDKPKDDKEKSKTGEVFNLDSDDDDKKGDNKDLSIVDAPREKSNCVNHNCTSDDSANYYLADRMTIAYYGAARRRKCVVCQNCLDVVNSRNEGLVSGIKDLRPLISLRMARPNHTLLEISDSDSEGEDEPVGEEGAKFLEDQLTDMLNEVWTKYNMDTRLKESEDYFHAELEKMQKQSDEVDALLRDCQVATDEMRVQFYANFTSPRHELPGISIHDTPIASYACLETEDEISETPQIALRYPKRRSSASSEPPAKMQALHEERKVTRSSSMMQEQPKPEDDKDISVVRLSAEAAPADLPPPGDLVKPPIRVGSQVYAMKNQYGAWLKGKVLEIQPKTNEAQYTICRIRFEHKVKNPCKMLSARSIAYTEPSEVRLTIGTRVIALFKNSENSNKKGEFYYSGVIAEIPNPVNGYRYLVFFDDGYAQYVEHKHTRLVYESKTLVWEEVHPFSRDFVCNYLMKYPERPMVRMHAGQEVNVEWNGKWWDTKVIKVDAALVQVQFPDNRTEWIYRGATRLKPLFNELLAAKRSDRARLPRSTKANTKTNVPYVEYTRSDDQVKIETQSAEDLRRQRSVAKKSTTIAQQISNAATDGVISRVVFYTPKNSVRPLKMVAHSCGPQCRRSDLLSLQDLRTYNPLTKPLLSGWERQIVRHKASRGVMYRAPCGRRVRCMRELHRYLRLVRSDMPVDLFDFNPNTHCLAEFVLNKTNVQKKDLSHGKENVPVPCVNYYDHSLPEFCSYNTDRTPTAGVPLNLDTEFLCGCDCDDDCADKTKCACWKMTLEGARTIGIDGSNIGYHYRRLPEPLPSGIYECNSRCKCKSTCLNRVVQNPLQLKLQVFKTLNRGWGIRALNDVPKGAFICIYAGNLLTDATANLDGLNEGDEYLAELDYIEVVEAMKEGYEDDVPELDKALDKKESKKSESEPESESTESEDESSRDKTDIQDGDFQPGYLSFGLTEFNKRLRRRDKKKNKDEQNKEQTSEDKPAKKEDGEECITISDDEEVRVSQREPSRFAAQETMTENKIVSKYRSIRSYFGKDEACYIMDAKVQGNIGRYLNHSCSPNVFVQNVFVDTHDPRFPWVSFFALHHIRAGTELTWNYNYDIGSVPGKVLYCYCGAPNCRRRLL